MRFTLTYDGLLPSRGDARTKHAIRCQMHAQLADLWATEPLSGIANSAQPGGVTYRNMAGRAYTAVVHNHFRLRAEMDVLLLRPGAPGSIITEADIDNRLKTLFDALRIPTQAQEVPSDWVPSADEDPLHCLLEDDRLITRIAVETDRWLAAPSQDHVRLHMRIRVWSPTPTWGSVALSG